MRGPIHDDDSQLAVSFEATTEEKQEIIKRFAELFLDHINKKCTPTASNISYLSYLMLQKARRGTFLSPDIFMLCYDLNYQRFIKETEKNGESVSGELRKFDFAVNWWVPRCLALSDQAKRLALVEGVVEVLKIDNDDEEDFDTYRRVRDCCRTYRPDGEESIDYEGDQI